MVLYQKKSRIWMIKKCTSLDTCVVMGVSQDHPRLNSDIIADIILPIVKASPWVVILVLIVNICSQYKYTPTYYEVWVAK